MKAENSFTREDMLRAYICTKSNYYLKALSKLETKGLLTFNLWAGVFPILWFVYRKMYLYACINFILLLFIKQILANTLRFYFLIDYHLFIFYLHIIVGLVLIVPMGYLGNYLYLRKVKKTVDYEYIYNETIMNKLRKSGNVDIKGVVVYILIVTVVSIFLS